MSDEQKKQDTPEEPQEAVQAAPQPYRESEDHVPDPTAFSGTLETSGTGGGRHARLEGVAEVFEGVTQQTVERDGLAVHEGAVVQDDTTGVPAVTNEQRVNDETNPLFVDENPNAVKDDAATENEPLSEEDAARLAKAAETPEQTSNPESSESEEAKSAPAAKKTAAKKTAASEPKK